jgi:phosphatidylethanolamine-binding protein (PEBP) family uncharacterized protein
MTFVVENPAFPNGASIPAKYTGAGQNVSPPLNWSSAPEQTLSVMLIVEGSDSPASLPFLAGGSRPAGREHGSGSLEGRPPAYSR